MPDKKIISLDELSRFKTNCDNEYQDTLVSGTNIKTINNTTILGSGNYEFDDTFNESSTNAVQNQLISKEIREINYELAVIREDLFETVLTEIDYKVEYGYTYTIPNTLSDTDGTHRVVFSETALKTIEFNSVVMNQQLTSNGFGTRTNNDVSFSSNDDYTMTIDGTASNIATSNAQYATFVNGHTYLLFGCPKNGGVSKWFLDTGANMTDYGNGIVKKYNGTTGSYYIRFYVAQGQTLNNVKVYYGLIDLTQMFGAGNEPTTTSDIRIQWLLSLGYIAYNTGSLLSTTTTGVQVNDSSDNVLGTISVPETSGKGAGNAHDYIEVVEGNIVEGEQLYNLVLHTLVGSVDLSNYIWAYNSDLNGYISNGLASIIARPIDSNTKVNLISTKYLGTARNDTHNNNDIYVVSSNGNMVVYDTAQSGTPTGTIYYELATEPTPTIIATDLRFDQISSLIQQGGNINALFTNVPPNVETTFVVKKAVGE